MIRHPELHRWRDPQRLMDPAKIVMRDIQADSRDMVL
jgi:hypothetical protein